MASAARYAAQRMSPPRILISISLYVIPPPTLPFSPSSDPVTSALALAFETSSRNLQQQFATQLGQFPSREEVRHDVEVAVKAALTPDVVASLNVTIENIVKTAMAQQKQALLQELQAQQAQQAQQALPQALPQAQQQALQALPQAKTQMQAHLRSSHFDFY